MYITLLYKKTWELKSKKVDNKKLIKDKKYVQLDVKFDPQKKKEIDEEKATVKADKIKLINSGLKCVFFFAILLGVLFLLFIISYLIPPIDILNVKKK